MKMFAIKGRINLIKAMVADLHKVGYSMYYLKYTMTLPEEFYITPTDYGSWQNKSKEQFKLLQFINSFGSTNHVELFHLPEDYQKALDYAIELFNNPNWNNINN